jgi:hypothetical protein
VNVHRLCFAYRAQMSLAGRFLLYFRQNWLRYTHELIVRPTAVYYPRPWLHMNPCCLLKFLCMLNIRERSERASVTDIGLPVQIVRSVSAQATRAKILH